MAEKSVFKNCNNKIGLLTIYLKVKMLPNIKSEKLGVSIGHKVVRYILAFFFLKFENIQS